MAKMFDAMADVIPEGRIGVAEIKHFTVSPEDSRWTALRPREYVPPGRYARLNVRGAIMMSDTRMEQITNSEVVSRATGDMLIAGLGLGMIVLPMIRNSRVRSVTVIEKHQDVIALVIDAIRRRAAKHAEKLRVINADIFDWRPAQKGRQFDVIYFDIWPDICTDNIAEMTRLRRAFAQYLRVGGWAACWQQEELRRRS